MSNQLTQDTITVGKYKGSTLDVVLRDRKYCEWLLKQKWFFESYEYLFNKIAEYDPKPHFRLAPTGESKKFVDVYPIFNLKPAQDVNLSLTESDKTCYEFYLATIADLKQRILSREEAGAENPFDIKAPSKWLIAFEKQTGLDRGAFREFITAYELPNITSVVEDIKKEGGITYLGAKSFLIAKERSLEQEQYWEAILKEVFDEDVSIQFKFNDCIFDMIHVKENILFECKLGMRDFNNAQYQKYLKTLDHYRMFYLIGRDCVIDMEKRAIYSTEDELYTSYITAVEAQDELTEIIKDFEVKQVGDFKEFFSSLAEK